MELLQGPTTFDKTLQRDTKHHDDGNSRTMSGTESLVDVTLRPWPASKKEELSPQDLLRQVEQLTHERGHLRNVTEKSLQEDVVTGRKLPEGSVGDAEEKTDKKDAPSKEERLQDVFLMHQQMSGHME
jgi:mediator of RNA polymerase II transcription subunit 17